MKSKVSAGLLRDSPVLSCARRLQRPSSPQISINSSPTESNSYHAASFARFAAYNAGQPLQGECRRFDPVSTHHLSFRSALEAPGVELSTGVSLLQPGSL